MNMDITHRRNIMNEEHGQEGSGSADHGAADRMVKEASRRYQDVPKKEDLKGFKFEKLFEGRVDKENFIYALVGGIILGFILMYIPVIGWAIALALGVVGLGMTARRLHDVNQTGWLALLMFVPVLGLVGVIYLALLDAVDKDNHYGPKPDPKRGFYHAILNI